MSALMWGMIILVGYLMFFTSAGDVIRSPVAHVRGLLSGNRTSLGFSPQGIVNTSSGAGDDSLPPSQSLADNKYLRMLQQHLSRTENKAGSLGIHLLFSLVISLVIFIVLVQKGSSGGLAGAFGGGDGGGVLGTKAGSFLSRITVWLGSAFLALALIYAILSAS